MTNSEKALKMHEEWHGKILQLPIPLVLQNLVR